MTNDERLRICAGIIRDFNANKENYGDLDSVTAAYDVLAEAWLAEHPADDEQSIDTKWLLSLGFEWNENETSDYLWVNNPKSGNKFDLIYLPTSCVWLLSDEINELTVDIRTRGDVRRLARALKVELGEQR
jgi:hypothetical protein